MPSDRNGLGTKIKGRADTPKRGRVVLSKPAVGSVTPEQLAWHRTVSHAASAIRRQLGEMDRIEADRIARCFRAMLLPRKPPGRKPSSEVLIATGMRMKGEPWKEIYPHALANYARMPFYERNYRCFNLRRAAAAYMKRQRLNNEKRHPNKTRPANV